MGVDFAYFGGKSAIAPLLGTPVWRSYFRPIAAFKADFGPICRTLGRKGARPGQGGRRRGLARPHPRLPIDRRDVLVRARPERFVGDIRMRLELVPELGLDRGDVEPDPTIVLARIAPG